MVSQCYSLLILAQVKIRQLPTYLQCTGALCGGIFIDEDFITKCSKRIGRKWSHFSEAHKNAILEDEWEVNIKSQFSLEDPSAKWLLSIENGPLSGADLDDTSRMPHIKRGIIHFSRKFYFNQPTTYPPLTSGSALTLGRSLTPELLLNFSN